MKTYRERSRIAAMVETQRIALELFRRDGFDAVTVEDIAASVGMAASTIYRHFGTKEAIVLWDEQGAEVDGALGRRLGQAPPLEAIRDTLIESIAQRWDAEQDRFQLQRISYIFATQQLHAAAVEADFKNRAELTDGLRHVLSRRHRHAAPILAGAALLALDVALEQWQQADGSRRLADLITEAFETLAHLDELS